MLVLDTNVISELMKVEPDPAVIAWLDAQASDSVWTSSIAVFEISFGLNSLPDGKRKRGLQEAFEAMLAEELEHHVLDFDQTAADRAGEFSAKLHGLGRPVEIRDVQIAGIVSVRHAVLATRNLKHFRDWYLTCRSVGRTSSDNPRKKCRLYYVVNNECEKGSMTSDTGRVLALVEVLVGELLRLGQIHLIFCFAYSSDSRMGSSFALSLL